MPLFACKIISVSDKIKITQLNCNSLFNSANRKASILLGRDRQTKISFYWRYFASLEYKPTSELIKKSPQNGIND